MRKLTTIKFQTHSTRSHCTSISTDNKWKYFGVGNAGCNILNTISHNESWYENRYNTIDINDCIAINMNDAVLDKIDVPNKIMMRLSFKDGCAHDSHLAQLAASDSSKEIARMVQGAELVFIVSSLENGTGPGAGLMVAKICREMGIRTCGIFIMPFVFEGQQKTRAANENLSKLKEVVGSYMLFYNDIFGDRTLCFSDVLKQNNLAVIETLSGLVKIRNRLGINNLSMNDLNELMTNRFVMGYGEGNGRNRVEDVLLQIKYHKALSINNMKSISKILINIEADNNKSTTKEIEHTINTLRNLTGDKPTHIGISLLSTPDFKVLLGVRE